MRVQPPVLVIHGGTGTRPAPTRLRSLRQRLVTIAESGYAFLRTHSALETAIETVRRLEDDPLLNAGTGSVLQQDGVARMSASVMDGSRRRFAAVLNIETVKNPVLVAEALLDQPDRVLADVHATRFARQRGFPHWDPVTSERVQQWRRPRTVSQGTVGAVALDRAGRLAAATSTGGKREARSGRVSDSGLPVGNYATENVAVSCTGLGEDILEEGLAVRLVQRVHDGATVKTTVAAMMRELKTRQRQAGLIALDRRGRYGWATTLPVLFAVARASRKQTVSF